MNRIMKTGIAMLLLSALLAGCGAGTSTGSSDSAPAQESSKETSYAEETTPTETPLPVETVTPEVTPTPEESKEEPVPAPTETPEEELLIIEAEAIPGELPIISAKPIGTAMSISIGTRYQAAYEESEDEENVGTLLATVTNPVITLSEVDAARYPNLAASLAEANEDMTTAADNALDQLRQGAVEMLANMPEYFGGFTEEWSLSVLRADPQVVSLGGEFYSYTGGVHGMYGYTTRNYDPESGTQLTLRDISEDPEGLVKTALAAVKEKYPNLSFQNGEDIVSAEGDDYFGWSVGYAGITFYFNPYILGSYAEGAQVVTVPFSGNEDLVLEKYRTVPDRYAFSVLGAAPYDGLPTPEEENAYYDGTAFDFDVDGDGAIETVGIYALRHYYGEESEGIEALLIQVGETAFLDEELYAYNFTPSVVYDRGRTFLYVELTSDNDYRSTVVYELTDGSAQRVGETGYSMMETYDAESTTAFREALSDPAGFYMAERMQMLGTSDAAGLFHVGEDGMPERLSGWLVFLNPQEMTVLKEFDAVLVGADGQETRETITLFEGTKAQSLRTDGAFYADILLEDGQIARVSVEQDEDGLTLINGESVFDLFDGLVFAG